MAEKLDPVRGQDRVPTSEDIHFENDTDSDIDSTDEVELLRQHKSTLRHVPQALPRIRRPYQNARIEPTRPPSIIPRSYAAQAASAAVSDIYVGRSGGLRDNPPNGRHRPRSVCIHTPNATIVPSALIYKLTEAEICPSHLQRLPNGDLEITFKTLEDKDRFFRLPYVHLPRRDWEPGMHNPPPVWVRIAHKPAELKFDVVVRKFGGFGRVLFARENENPGTEILNGGITFKMILTEPVPSFVHLGPYCLAVRHYGQPQTCRKCDSRGHIAAQCSIKRCYNCGLTGHINADCPENSRCQGCGSPEHHLVQCDASWVPEANRFTPEPSSDLAPRENDSSGDEDSNAAGAVLAQNEAAATQGPSPSAAEEENCSTAANQEADNSQQSPNWSDTMEQTAGSAGADPAQEETAVTHVSSPSNGGVGTENCPIAAPGESASIQNSSTPEDNGQAVKNWYDPPTPVTDGMISSSKFSSPILLSPQRSVEAGAPAASKRSFQEDNVSDISAVRRPSTKKKQKGRSARQPAPS